MSDWLLAFWLVIDLVWSIFVLGLFSYLTFLRGHSYWWFIFAVFILLPSTVLFKALAKRFGVEEKESED